VDTAGARTKKALELIEQKGIEGLIVYSGGTCSILTPSYLHYFAGYRPLGPRNAAILTRAGKATLLVEPAWDRDRVAKRSWISDVRGTSSFVADLVTLACEHGLKGRVGVAGVREMQEGVYGTLSQVLTLESADALIEEIAREKTPKELETVRRASRIAHVGFLTFFEQARPGMREFELVAEMEYGMRRAGADDIFILLSTGKHNYEMHEGTDRRLEPGDILIGEITPVCDGQFIQLCRTVVLGEPNPLLIEKYDLLLRALREALRPMKAGAPASAMSREMNRVLSDAGYGKYCYPPFMRARGHGFGVGSLAPGGAVDDDTRTTFELNQVVVVHPNQYLPETGYLACGETVLITATGVERLAETETKLYSKEV
jgi:Xaa-Pro dipeptidase